MEKGATFYCNSNLTKEEIARAIHESEADFHPHLLNTSALEQQFGTDTFVPKRIYYNKECILSDAPTEMPMEKRTMKIDYTK